MSKITGISFSYAKNSMNTRGLTLMDLNSVHDMSEFDMPICNVNIADGVVPPSVHKFIKVLQDADILVFAIPENTAHYGAGFKNAMDWLICASNYNADLGQDGAFFNKPIYVITFTPSYKPSGDRHFNMTKHLLQDKMGGLVYNSFVKNGGWIECIPGNTQWVQKEREEIFNTIMPEPHPKADDWKNMPRNWVEQYKIWDNKWKPMKHSPDKVKYEFIDTNYVNGIPFPRLPVTIDTQHIPLKTDYWMRSMDYLDTPEAYALFEKQADLIIENGWKGIVDVGCRHGPINDILHAKGYTDYRYMGFDTSTQPIEYAQDTWQEFNNIEYRVLSWNEFKDSKEDRDHKFKVNFNVDVMIWSGVLLYEPDDHLWYFHNMHKAYGAQNAIIQEPLRDQRPECWREDLELNTIEDKLHLYKDKYHEYESWKLDLDIFSGRRIISRIKLWQDDDPQWVDCDNEFRTIASTPKTEILPCGYKIIPYIFKGKLNMELSQRDQTLCQAALVQMDKERHTHRLADNYDRKGLHLGKMFLYNFVFDGDEPVFCSGAQTVNELGIRVFSRYFAFEKYKTDGTTQLDKNDDFEELRWTMSQIRGKVIFWSRDKSSKFFQRLKEGRPDIFSDWTVHDKKINIIYTHNEQYIFYVSKLPLGEKIEFE